MTVMTAVNPEIAPAPSAARLFCDRVIASGPRVALKRKVDGQWQGLTWNDCDRTVRELGAGLRTLGVEKSDRVVLVSETRAEWVLAELGTLLAGAVCVPIYPSNTSEQCAYIVADAGAKVAIAEDPKQVEKLLDPRFQAELGDLQIVYLLGTAKRPDGSTLRVEDVVPLEARGRVRSLTDICETGREEQRRDALALDEVIDGLGPDDVFSIVYTSGTTGPPKGGVLTHGNLTFECAAVSSLLPIDEDDEQLIFLPLAHIFGRLMAWVSIERGVPLAFAESISELPNNMREVRPTFMAAVPRVYEKVHAKVQTSIRQASAIKRALFRFAVSAGRRVSGIRREGKRPGALLALKRAVGDRLVLRKLRAAFGGRIKFLISGGAPLAPEIAEFFHAADILILEGWGLTETTAGTCFNRPERFRFGTVGPAVPGIELKVAVDGEVLVRGGSVMREYHGKPEATAEAIDAEGWFRTGDIGTIEDGFLRITDRKKDILVTSGGKNIAPQNLENALKAASPLLSQVMVYGDKRPYLVALVTLAEESVVPWARERGITFGMTADLARCDEVRTAIQEAVDGLNSRVANYETIKRFHIVERDFSQETGELTPTMKVKRKFTSQKYARELAAMYDEGAA